MSQAAGGRSQLAQSSQSAHTARLQRRRALALGVLLGLLASAGLWTAWKARRDRATGEVQVVGDRALIDALLAERARESQHSGAQPAAPQRALDPPALVREPIPESIAQVLFPQIRSASVGVAYDPHAFFCFRGNIERRIPFHDRPEEMWIFHTNSAGMRRDKEVSPAQPDVRILVAGDSQTEGYCTNSESFPNVLEELLGARMAGKAVEVLNTGKSSYSFYNYLGILEKYLDLDPDVFVMVVYGGNDFIECLSVHHYFQRTERPSCEACNYEYLVAHHPTVSPNYFQQALLQLRYFRHHPDERKLSLDAACLVTAEVQRVTREHGIRFVLVYMPPVIDVQPRLLGSQLDENIGLLALEPADLKITDELADAWLADARARGIACLDLRTLIARAERLLYWKHDLHLNVEGNRLVADSLLSELIEQGQ